MRYKWAAVPLAQVLSERREVPTSDDLLSGRVRIIEKIGFNDGRIHLRVDGLTKTGMILVRPGDLVVSGINAAKGAIAIYDREARDPVAATIHYGAYEPRRDLIDTRFLWWMLRSRFFRGLLLDYVPGGIKTELKAKRLLPIPVPVPTLAEQRRMVALIEGLAVQVEEARTLRHQAVEEAEALALAELGAVFAREAESRGTTRLNDLLVEAGYGSSEKCESERVAGATPVLRIPNVAAERISLTDLKYAPLKVRERAKLVLSEGDVLLVRTNGSADLVGRSAVVPKLEEPFAFASYIIRLRFDRNRVDPDYAQCMLRYLRVSGALVDLARTTAGQYNVSVGRLRAAQIPVPPLADQRRIVTGMDALQAEVDALRRLQSETSAELDAMLPAIVDRTFSGDL